MDFLSGILGGVVGLILLVLLFVLGAFWLIFPWMVYAQLRNMIDVQKRLEDLLKTIADQGGRSQQPRSLPVAARPTRSGQHSFRYFYSRDGADSGPHTLQEMLHFWQSGTLNADTLVVREGDTEWRAFSQFPEFAVS